MASERVLIKLNPVIAATVLAESDFQIYTLGIFVEQV